MSMSRRPRHDTLSAGAVQHIAPTPTFSASTSRSQPPLRKSMSRVLSRVLSITRKEQPPVHATVRSSPERAVDIERGYEVISRVTSTHLNRSRDGRGLSDGTSSSHTARTNIPPPAPAPAKPYPLYAHPALPTSSPRPALEPRRPSVTTKLSRGQIAKFRQASITASASSSRASVPLPSNHTHGPPERRRHLASSRSTAEMRGSRSSGESSRPTSWISSAASNAGRASVTGSTSIWSDHIRARPSSVDSQGLSAAVDAGPERYPYVCPDRLIQRSRPTSPSLVRLQPVPPSQPQLDTGPVSSPEASTPPSRTAGYRKPVPTYTESPCSTTLSMPTSEVTTPEQDPRPSVDSEALDCLFDEVMRGCLPDPADMSTPRPPPLDTAGSTSLIIGQSSSQLELLAAHAGGDSETGSPTPTKRIVSRPGPIAAAKRFIPSGRSFEPLKSARKSNIPGAEGPQQGGGPSGSRVKEAIAKFEKRISAVPPTEEPITPVKILGTIIDRPPTVSSAGLSDQSRRMMWEARQNRGIR